MSGDERIRLFCALRLPDETLERLDEWLASLRLPGGVRRIERHNLHVTLAFLGHRPVGELDGIAAALRDAATAAEQPLLGVERYRETRSVAMLALRDAGGRAGALARDLHARLHELGVYDPEQREWLPHVTVLRFRERPRLRVEPPELGEFSPSDAAAYLSRLRPGGAQYEVLESFALGG